MRIVDPACFSLISLNTRLIHWLRNDALPLWDRHGVDRNLGGYREQLWLDPDTGRMEGSGEVRRGRVVARQIYAFDVGQRLGWESLYANPVHHGCHFLFSRMHQSDGLFQSKVFAAANQTQSPFSLYEHAFYLFALARVYPTLSPDFPIEATATRCLRQLRLHWGKSSRGFEETNPPSPPLKSNPHMHLLEAALAWIEATDGTNRYPWVELAQEIVTLCLTRFLAADTGALREYFDAEWRPMADESGRIVEPGHQFEWAWLLMQWSQSGYCDVAQRRACHSAASGLIGIGERWGVDPVRGVAFNEVWDDMTPKDCAAKLWPQTERIKAWCAMLAYAQSAHDADVACQKIELAVKGLWRYLDTEPLGLWHEVMLPDGSFVAEPSKASSFYHIVCAIETLQKTLSGRPALVL